MAVSIPTQAELIHDVASYFETDIAGSTPRLPACMEYALSRAQAGQTKGLYDHLSYILRQVFPDRADAVNFWHWASIWGIFQKAAVAWAGTYQFAGTNGTIIPALTQLGRADGPLYTTAAQVTITGGVALATLNASAVGALSNNANGQQLSLTTPILGVTGIGTVQSTTITGSDIETREDGLLRLLLRIRTPPSGGGPGDYVRWALEVAGNTRAWEFPLIDGPNTVAVAFTRDLESPIVPDSTERAAGLAHIATKAPITVGLSVLTLATTTIDIVLSSLTPNTLAIRNAIAASVADLLYREGGPGKTISLSRLREAISAAAGENSHVLTTPSADLVFTNLQVPIMGTVTVV